jgi:hypothetical protein
MTQGIDAKIIKDSISPDGIRLTTAELSFHRFVLAEFNTHRVFSRNSASSRAIPVAKQIGFVETTPALPVEYFYNQPGMQASEPMTPEDEAEAIKWILWMRDQAVVGVKALNNIGPINPETGSPLGLHKQWANRYLEPFMWHTVIVTSVDFDNYFHQRSTEFSPLGQPEIRAVTDVFLDQYRNSVPELVEFGQWHLPYILEDEEGLNLETKKMVSVARCARVSYLTHDGVRDITKDIELYEKLVDATPPHASPLEHVATPADWLSDYEGNFPQWHQLRHLVGK